MRVIKGWKGLMARDRGAAIALGNFDGVHLGHRAVIAAALAARKPIGAGVENCWNATCVSLRTLCVGSAAVMAISWASRAFASAGSVVFFRWRICASSSTS